MLTIHGQGSQGLVVFDALKASNPSAEVKWTDAKNGSLPKPTDYFICAIGDNRTRLDMGGTLTVIHPAARISDTAEIGQGVFVGAFAFIGPKAKIGDYAIINNGAIIEHECEVGRAAHVASGAVLSGRVVVGEGVLVGAGATVRIGQKIGAWAVVGAGAVVVDDIPDGQTWVGNPARQLVRD
ncbi:MAG: NeuD/PglB/VioB family sugar acetyltransferase [Chloroflexi bacterium]|nr:NeuD/PglB/VioB family sugar acetyltransferase [Chloroflexota bacterium]MBE3118783.1 NeuD/PglB/VioB family sugar acetyltransferase [Candidatus Atribacteria bacterium]